MPLKVDMRDVLAGWEDANHFHAQLIRLFFKADHSNFARLASAFPNTARTVSVYQETGEILDLPYEVEK